MKAVCHVTVTGHPAISVPAGFAPDGTPVGVQIVGKHRGERDLLAIAAAFENLTGYVGPCIRGWAERPDRTPAAVRPRHRPAELDRARGWWWDQE